MKGKVLISVLGLVGIVVLLGGIKALQIGAMVAQAERMVPPPESVATAKVTRRPWQAELHAIGSLNPVQGVMISAELSGVVRKIGFENGAVVRKGDLLVQLDTDLEEAQLRSAEAQAELSKLDLDRAKQLRADRTIAQSELDTVDSRHKQAVAQVEALRATIAKKTLTAPFSGRAGIRKVNLGQFVDAGKPIVSLQSTDPIYADFHLPQQRLADLRTGLAVNLRTDAFPDRAFDGTLSAINAEVDEATRNVHLQATIPNPDGALRPGMFVRVAVVLPNKENVLTIPATSVLYAPYGNSVFAIEDAPAGGKIVRQRFVRLGPTIGDFVAISEGLKEGEEIVSAGAFKLRGGMHVSVNNAIGPESRLQPEPDDT
ncbi:MAG TPA: efflux RND transporter periplasmic adaptor subunit [Verrucomicrobiae bacterium]|nr:efflux RND transporter periplasmic adaptor subunit [Verrucomicrobiae bacterium]